MRTRPCALGLALIIALLFACTAPAQQPKASEAEIEAVYVFKFSQFITWPRTTQSEPSFDICILGDDPLGPFLDRTIRGEKISGKPVIDRRIARPQDAQDCAIVYLSRSEAFRLRQDLMELRVFPVLTVSDIPQFADKGGMIEFVLQSGRVRFLVNLTPAEQAGLSFSSELLKVAVDVKGAGAQGSH
jgi:hypothetical protein